ncbi:MAG: amidohydrolase family protein [Verrucomicrobiae bacterium]|nr:amidohydrolase family protein [Verrucomicrobiae bacterium]
MKSPLTLLHLACAALAALAASAPAAAETVVLRGGILHTVSGPTLTNAPLVLRHGLIAAVGTEPAQAPDRVVELNGAHVFPGLIAPLTLLGLVEIDAVRATRDSNEVGEFTPDVYAWLAVNPDSELIPVARANGYTHAQATPSGGLVAGHSSVIALHGWTIEETAVRRVTGLHVAWPPFALNTTPRSESPQPDRWRSIEDQIRDRERRLRDLDEFFNEAEAYARRRAASSFTTERPRLPGEPNPRPEPPSDGFLPVPAWEAMLPVLRGEIPVFLHANEIRQIRSALEWAARRHYRVVLAGGRDAWRLPDDLARQGVPVAFDHVFTLPARDTDPYDVHFTAPAVLARAGVKFAFSGGADRFGASNVRNIPYAASHAVAFGLPRDEALRALTLHPAQMLGLGDRLGSLEAGKDATLFVADADILDLRANVLRMWIAGREVPLETRHTRLYERYRAR